MRAIAISAPGGPDVLRVVERPVPQPSAPEADAVAIVALVGALAAGYGRVRPIAGVVLVPLLAWCVFGLALTRAIGTRNA